MGSIRTARNDGSRQAPVAEINGVTITERNTLASRGLVPHNTELHLSCCGQSEVSSTPETTGDRFRQDWTIGLLSVGSFGFSIQSPKNSPKIETAYT